MEYVIIGGDGRLAHLARLLKARGGSVGMIFREPVPGVPALGPEALSTARAVVANYPLKTDDSKMTFEKLLTLLPENARVFACGPKHPDFDPRVADLFADEGLLVENAALTAEGAIAAAMSASETAIAELRCLVIGWGRIGRALTERLVALGAKATVASRSESGRNRAVERGAEAVPTGEIGRVFSDCDLVFNTAPGPVLSGSVLERAAPDALLIDLASPPYGIDLATAWSLGLRAWREPALPGRYCPRSAARVILRAMDRAERGVRHE